MADSNHKNKLVIVGSSGHASVLLDAIEVTGTHSVLGFLDDTLESRAIVKGYQVLGRLADAQTVCGRLGVEEIVLAIGDNWLRRKVYLDLIKLCPSLKFPAIKHPSSVVARSAQIGNGAAVLAACHIGPGSRIGDFCIVNTGSSLDHDCILGDFASIAPGVFTGGNVRIGEYSAIGVGASISHRICVGSHAVVGTGAAVVRDLPDHVVAYGNPARVRRSREEGEPHL